MLAGIGTFCATRHPGLALEAAEATLVTFGGAAAGGLIGTGGAVVTEWVIEENKDEKKHKKEPVRLVLFEKIIWYI